MTQLDRLYGLIQADLPHYQNTKGSATTHGRTRMNQARRGLKPNGRVYGSWGEVFRHWVGKGYDHGYAAFEADAWEKRSY